MAKEKIGPQLIKECKAQLLKLKADILNRVREGSREHLLQENTTTGDEIDQSVALLAENQFISSQNQLRLQLKEIELALMRIENGSYGVCEETEEPIEKERLLAIPWTRLSIEGAEIQESVKKRFAR